MQPCVPRGETQASAAGQGCNGPPPKEIAEIGKGDSAVEVPSDSQEVPEAPQLVRLGGVFYFSCFPSCSN